MAYTAKQVSINFITKHLNQGKETSLFITLIFSEKYYFDFILIILY